MKYCPDCGVAVSGNHTHCLLCGTILQDNEPHKPADALPPLEGGFASFTRSLRVRPWTIFFITAAVVAAPALITLLVDRMVNGYLSWSLIVAASMLLLLIYIGAPGLVFAGKTEHVSRNARRRRRHRRFFLLMLLDAIATEAFLITVDFLDGSGTLDWSPDFGVLLCLALFSTVLLSYGTLQPPRAKGKGYLMFVWISLFTIAVEMLVNGFFGRQGFFGWSFIVSASLLPFGILYLIIVRLVEKSETARRRLHV